MSLDSFLNVAIPVGIVFFFGFLLYSKLKEPIHAFIAWIRGLFETTAEHLPEPRPQIIYD